MRRTQIKAGKPLARGSGFKRKAETAALARTSMARAAGIRKVSRRREEPEVRAEHDRVRTAVFARDGHRCILATVPGVWPACYGRLTVHHIKKAGQGGAYAEPNLTSACVVHNDLVESDADFAAACRLAGFNDRSTDPDR